MSKLSSIEKNNRRRRLVEQHKVKRKALKAKAMDKSVGADERFVATLKLAEMPRNGAKTRIRNRCEMTGRARGYYRKMKLSRIKLRELAAQGLIPGMTKSSW